MTNNQKRQLVYKQMFTLNVMNQILVMSLQNQSESIAEVTAYLDHQSQQLASKARLSKATQEDIIKACHDRLRQELRAETDSVSEVE